MIQRSVPFLSSQNLEVIRWVTSLLSPSKNMQFCNEQIRTQPLFSPPCASATYGSARMCSRKNINIFQYVNIHVNLLKIIPVLEMAWHQKGDQVLWHIQISINSLRPSDAYILNLTILGSDKGLSPGRRQAIIWTNAGILLIRTLGTNFSEILFEIHSFSFSKMHLKMSSVKWRLFGLGLNELTHWPCERQQVPLQSMC